MAAPRILATICTNRPAHSVRPSLAAVAGQVAVVEGTAALLVASGVDAERRAGLEALAAELGVRTAGAGAGLSVARNRALDEAGNDEVVAFIDDDALPHADWLAHLHDRWAAAGPGTACIGGAIEPRLIGVPPRWFGERIWTSYSLLDKGPGLAELRPGMGEDVWGANVSFRVGAARDAGGFNPARGPWRGFPMFGDESDLERRLEAAGHSTFYAGDVRVEHVIDAQRLSLRSLARRERWRGVSLVVFGLRRPLSGVPRAVKAAAGVLVATLRGDRPLAGERRARLAREGGVSLAPLLTARLRRRGWPG